MAALLKRTLLRLCLGLLTSGLLGASALAAAPMAGTVIRNQALCSYFDTDSGFASALNSNTVLLTVQPVEALTLSAPALQSRAPGSYAQLPFQLVNSGNVASRVSLSLGSEAGSGFELQSPQLFLDRNGNGQVDPGEPTVAPGETLALAIGERLSLVLQGGVPASAGDGRTARHLLTAVSQLQGARQTALAQVTTAAGATVRLVDAVSALTAAPSDLLTFTLSGSNTGQRAATGVPISIDGIGSAAVLLRALVPANTQLDAVVDTPAGQSLYHLQGEATHRYRSSPPADLTLVDAVAFVLPALDVGQSMSRAFSVRVHANASGQISHAGELLFNDGLASSAVTVASNTTQTTLASAPPRLAFYTDASFSQVASHASPGGMAFLQADAAQCNADPTRIEVRRVVITSAITGDVETFLAQETGLNTGTFRVLPGIALTDAASAAQLSGDSVLSTGRNDKWTATMEGCGATTTVIELLIDPFGVVYDSRSNLPLAGATVALIDVTGAGNGGRPGQLATVFKADGSTPSPNTVLTGADGVYEFPTVGPSRYRLQVSPAPNYSFPSALAMTLLPTGRANGAASYGADFEVNLTTGPVHVDLPLDGSAQGGLAIDKSASRASAEIGDLVDYQVRVRNSSQQLLGRIVVDDQPPRGFAYVPGSARLSGNGHRLDGSVLPEPAVSTGGGLSFQIGSIANASELSLSYRLRIAPAAVPGDAVNRARASSAVPLVKTSNLASATVRVLPGAFSDRGFVVGRVWADCPAAPVVDGQTESVGVPGVRLVLENGSSVVTDAQGRYSLYDLRPQTHVLKLDRSSLPDGAALRLLDSRQAGDPASRFVDMKAGQLLRADFALQACDEALRQQLANRAAQARSGDEGQAVLAARFSADGVATPLDTRAQPASGQVRSGIGAASAGRPDAGAGARRDAASSAAAAMPALEALLGSADAALGFAWPPAQQVLGVAQTNVVVKGPAGAVLRLQVNGQPVPAQRIGRRSVDEAGGLQALEFIGLDLMAGTNHLLLTEHDPADGQAPARAQASLALTAPGRFARLSFSLPEGPLVADGKSLVRLLLRATDAAGVAIGGRTAVTLDRSSGQWQLADLDPLAEGLQTVIENGQALLTLRAPAEPGEVEVSASADDIRGRASLRFLPELRPLLAVGVVEGRFNLNRLHGGGLLPSTAQDGFEQQLRHLSWQSADGQRSAGARAALFLKGKVRGDTLLTLAYDSDKADNERLFRDIQPDEFYPVYGDDSAKGFDAQSTGRLYVRLDHGRSHLLFGDFVTQSTPRTGKPMRQLSTFNRSLNGLQGRLDSDTLGLTAFASQTSARQAVQELPAQGLSLYFLSPAGSLLANSERVELLTRDRNQPALVLQHRPLTRLVDYTLDADSGRLLLKAPVASLDGALNPQSLRVSYELAQGGPQHWVYGADARWALDEQIELAAMAVRDDDPQQPLALQGASVTLQLGPQTTAFAELAHSHSLVAGSGRGARTELRHDGERLQASAQAGQTSAGFDNPGALLGKGRSEAGVKAALRLTEQTQAKIELLYSQGQPGVDGRRSGGQLSLEHSLGNGLALELGLRQAHATGLPAAAAASASAPAAAAAAVPATSELTSARLKLSGKLPVHADATAYAEYEQDLDDHQKRVAAVGADYRLSAQTRLYARHELISSLGNRYTLGSGQQRNASVLGIDSQAGAQTHVFSEYRVRDGLSGREAQAALGLRRQWLLTEGLGLQAGVERVDSFKPGSRPAVALTSGLDATLDATLKGSARLEWRGDDNARQTLSTLGLAWKLDRDWTVLGRNVLSLQSLKGGGGKSQERFQLGLAYRDGQDHQLDGLARYEHRVEMQDALAGAANTGTTSNTGTGNSAAGTGAASRRSADIVSAHLSHQPRTGLNLSGRLAFKHAVEDSAGQRSAQTLALMGARVDADLSPQWNLGLNLAGLFSLGQRSRQTTAGVELGWLAGTNLWLSLGVNLVGFREDELAGDGSTQRGLFFRLRLKFDEQSLP